MSTFNSNKFIKSLKKSYDAIPVLQGDAAAKVMVADSMKSNGYNAEDVLYFIYSKMNPSVKLSETEWKQVVETAIKYGGYLGKNLEVYKKTLKGKVSYEEMFKLAAECYGVNPALLQQEFYLDKMNWAKVVDRLIKTIVKSEDVKKEETSVEKHTFIKEPEKKSSIKTHKMDPRCKSIILVNKDGEVKEWPSYRICEKELGLGFGTVSQLVSGKLKQSKGWYLWKEESKTPVKSHKHPRNKVVRQYGVDKEGNKVDRIWSSITEASKATGISHSGISKTVTGTYQSAGGYKWEKVSETAA